jgi:EAL domain-containing protein (putative c-di-GMP-specific phosphodiesterase class I)
LPVIEDHALSVAVGDWVVETAVGQVDAWLAQGLALEVSVNVGARQLQQDDFVDKLRDCLARHPSVSPRLLTMEVLETSALEDLGRTSKVIDACARIGVDFALDDFGTGYSSLTYLKHLPVTLIKIDQSFVSDMLNDSEDLAILQGVVGLAHAFKRKVIAEGMETPAHGSRLLALGCELAQGYGIARPMPAAEVPDWLDQWQPDASWTPSQMMALP